MNRITKSIVSGIAACAIAAPLVAVPSNAYAQKSQSDRRQQTKNEWRNLAIGSGALAILGLINKDRTLTFAGTIGALYSAHRYEQDRKSQSKLDRFRADMFSKKSFVRDGYRYTRKTKYKNGKKYYYFVKNRI